MAVPVDRTPLRGAAVASAAVGLALLLSVPVAVSAQQEGDPPPEARLTSATDSGSRGRDAPAVLRAVRLEGPGPVLDGRLDDPAWEAAPVATGFRQFQPDEGAPASQRTEVRVLYGHDALWVGMRARDTAADSIAAQLTRRDQGSYSDQLGVLIDSYYDRRTAFQFAVNPRGVKRDVYHFDDTAEDGGWDAVWDVATAADDQGWTAEFRIPYSQLRFRDATEQTWGINFYREIARHDEISVWAPTRRSESRIVSRFGELRGLRDLEMPRRLEVTPYTLTRVRRAPGEPGDPFHERTALDASVGADVKYGLTGDLTLDATINPDFGQVEADPAQVNLTAFETFLPERRPFFVEGSNLFSFSLAMGDGDGANESLFYSRRIGRSPHLDPSGGDRYADTPENTTIMGAWKLSGKTAGGWSIGTLAAVTGEETARVTQPGADVTEMVVEPLTVYGVARVSRDFRDGRSALGLVGTVVSRDREAADALELRSSAYTGGVDARHRFGDDGYQVSGYVLGSHVQGSREAIARTQRSSARWFHRPDADHVTYDPTRTSLSGFASQGSVEKISGSWRWATGFQSRSPGFEPNDVGYMQEADFNALFGYAAWVQSTPRGPFRSWRVNLNGFSAWSWGGERYNSGGNVNGHVELASFWSVFGGVNHNVGGLSNATLRGGPAMRREDRWNGWGGFNSDGRKPLRLQTSVNWSHRPESGSWSANLSPRVSWRPSGRASLSVGTSFSRNVDDQQWVARITADADHYLFGRLDQTTVGLVGRLDYAFTPTLSLQLYAQPFVSAGEYTDFKRVVDPRAERYESRLAPVDAVRSEDGGWGADLNGDGQAERWGNPDFNVMQFRSNAVLRWEYRPGSSLYLVWSQGRDRSARDGTFDLDGDLDALFGVRPDNILMLKVSYWMNP